ncbi:hypothetical protein GPA19_05195 [Azoarcus indigens]|uniref:RecT family protein n=1 Tax=Azoarcus indigens TaxID=29545 RepID=A0A4R6DXU3_9RHOO|nr:RecT family recombinase [Azoarcus indigens]NMG64340.1 hypothetical protein [Azoarcus indigens]TDN49208.1 RecT family protein [Azoarcus indigens]
MSNVTALSTSIGNPLSETDAITSNSLIMSAENMGLMMNFAKIMATGRVTVPQELRNEGDCLAITMQAMMWGMNPFAVAQKTHVVSGKLGYEAQLVNAVINKSGVTRDRMHFEWFGPWEKVLGKFDVRKGDKGEYRVPNWKPADEEGCGVRAWATLKGESEARELELLLTQARTRNSTLWADDPRQQLAYLAQKRWCRLYAPDVLLGVYTADELTEPVERDMGAADVVEQPQRPATRTNALKGRLGVGKQAAPQQPSVSAEQVLAAIEAITDRESADAAKALGEQLPPGPEKDEASAAYARKIKALQAAAEQKTAPADDDNADDFLRGYEAEEKRGA